MSGGTAATAAPALPDQPPGERAVTVLWSFGKCLGALVPVYLAGYYGFSISVVLLGLMIYMGWKHSRLDKVVRLKSAMYLLENERQFTTERVFRTTRDLPPWVRSCIHTLSRHHVSGMQVSVTSVTSARLNLSCIFLPLCTTVLCYLHQQTVTHILVSAYEDRETIFFLATLSMPTKVSFVHCVFLLCQTSPIFRHCLCAVPGE